MLKKILILVLLIIISFSIYTVLANLYLDRQYEQDVSSMQRRYTLSDNLSIPNPNSISIPSSLRRYIQASIPDHRNLSTYVNLNYSGKYRKDKYGEMFDFKVKSFYNLKNEEFVSEWFIDENRVTFNKLREVSIGDKQIYEFKYMGIKNNQEVYGQSALPFLKSRMIIDAVYFPYYYLASGSIDYRYMSNNRTLLELNTTSGKLNYVLDFNEQGKLISITTDEFNFDGNRVSLKAYYDDYIDYKNYNLPASITVEIENNFDKYVLYEANLDSVTYR
ncbi:hypothetical protein C7957_10521 [Halanaerobium saccharolyticum]|uniref:Uncharacterized protein n=1 Tax=Halanaerobium saccharolyticum TaxID=43595 RepID=A0A4R6SEA0_9FIRM|nr:DUF6544 family protein [Halanaerobium saccharolyticum]TDP98222.1 hypothetical protein C7957_10521 [Halanaerobium saccharolyticum]